MKIITGGVTAAKGFEAAGVEAAIKYQNRKDMALIVSKVPCTVAGTFTSNVVKAAPVLWDKQIVEHSAYAQAVVVNSGIANACTGKQGLDCCEAEAKCAGELLGVPTDAVLVASTGVIGMQIPVDKITAGIKKLVAAKADTLEAGSDAAHAIMTTDTISKEIAIETEIGGKTSHSAILARALEIPAVLGIAGALEQLQDGQTAIVDGGKGEVLISPDTETLYQYTKLQEEQLRQKAMLSIYRDKPTVDADGRQYQLYANIGSVMEAQAALDNGAEGIGLFRTEFLFMDRPSMPDEEEQYEAYAAVSRIMQGREVIIRTLDVGGDKEVSYLKMGAEQNPFLGWRAIRYCLEETDLYKTQLRALLRAGAQYRNIKIMLPLVTGVQEVRAAKALLEECKQELKAANLAYDPDVQVGVMIETPAAALTADLLAKEAAFFSIGTNDLTQYTIAVDRGNAKVEKLYTALHPAVLRSIRNVIQAGREAGIPVGMCGESAADPALIPLLLHFGLDEFSVSASSVLATRKTISEWSGEQAAQLTEQAMALATPDEVGAYLHGQVKA